MGFTYLVNNQHEHLTDDMNSTQHTGITVRLSGKKFPPKTTGNGKVHKLLHMLWRFLLHTRCFIKNVDMSCRLVNKKSPKKNQIKLK